MKVDLLGEKCLPSAGPIDQAVVPLIAFPSESVQSKAAPPQGCTSIPRCFLYQSHSALGSLALMKIPPMPVTLRIQPPDVSRQLLKRTLVEIHHVPRRVVPDRQPRRVDATVVQHVGVGEVGRRQ